MYECGVHGGIAGVDRREAGDGPYIRDHHVQVGSDHLSDLAFELRDELFGNRDPGAALRFYQDHELTRIGPREERDTEPGIQREHGREESREGQQGHNRPPQHQSHHAVIRSQQTLELIAVVDGVKREVAKLLNVPSQLVSHVVFDQSEFVKQAIETLWHEGGLGLLLTSILILVFLGSMRATVAVLFSIPLSALAAFVALYFIGGSINTMVLGGQPPGYSSPETYRPACA